MLRKRLALGAVVGAAVFSSLAGAVPASASTAAQESPQALGTIHLCSGPVLDGNCIDKAPQTSNARCTSTGRSDHSVANNSTQGQFFFTGTGCTGIESPPIEPGDLLLNFPIGSYTHT